MKKIPILFLGLLGGLAACTRIPPAIAPDKKIETRIGELLQKMTLEEKIGQMCQLTAGVVIDQSDPQHPVLSEALLDTVIGRYKVGSILNIPFGVGRPVRCGPGLSIASSNVRSTNWGFPVSMG